MGTDVDGVYDKNPKTHDDAVFFDKFTSIEDLDTFEGTTNVDVTGVILVIFKPLILLDLGFIYSFLTTFGLMYGSSILNKHKIIGTSIIAFLASLPVTINNFYEFNIFSIKI